MKRGPEREERNMLCNNVYKAKLLNQLGIIVLEGGVIKGKS